MFSRFSQPGFSGLLCSLNRRENNRLWTAVRSSVSLSARGFALWLGRLREARRWSLRMEHPATVPFMSTRPTIRSLLPTSRVPRQWKAKTQSRPRIPPARPSSIPRESRTRAGLEVADTLTMRQRGKRGPR